jgi:hypothetical protein
MHLIPVKQSFHSLPLFLTLLSLAQPLTSLINPAYRLSYSCIVSILPSFSLLRCFLLRPALPSHPVFHSSLNLFLPTFFRRSLSLSAYAYLALTYHWNPIIAEVMNLWSLICILSYSSTPLWSGIDIPIRFHRESEKKKCTVGVSALVVQNHVTYFLASMEF